MRPLRVAGSRVQALMPKDLSQADQIVVRVPQELMSHRMPKGRFAQVGIIESKYKGTHYSAPYFLAQTGEQHINALALEQKDKAGGIPWNE